MPDTATVQQIALSFPGTHQRGSVFEVDEKGFAWYHQDRSGDRPESPQDSDVLVVRVADLDEKQELLRAYPEKYYSTEQYEDYPAVLVRLSQTETEELIELLEVAWRSRASRMLVTEYDIRGDDDSLTE